MLLTTLSLWVLMAYNLRVAFFGNPLLEYVRTGPEGAIRELDEMGRGADAEPPSPEAALFLQGFVRRFLLALVVLVLELSVLVRLFWIDILPWLAMGLLVKDLVSAAVGSLVAHSVGSESGMFGAFHAVPRWVPRMDRFSSLLSGAGALAILVFLACR